MYDVVLTDNSDKVLELEQAAVLRALEAIGTNAEGYAKESISSFPAVDTGRLLNSITYQVQKSENAVYIGTNVEYGKWVELGTGVYASDGNGRKSPWQYTDKKTGKTYWTKGIKPVHYLRDATTTHTDEYKKLMEESLKNA